MDEKPLENRGLRKWGHLDKHVINPNPQGGTQAFLPPVLAAFSHFFDVVWAIIISFVFGAKPPFSNFLGVVWTGPKPF